MRSLEVVNAFEGGSKHDRMRRQTQFYTHIRYTVHVHVQYAPKNFPFPVRSMERFVSFHFRSWFVRYPFMIRLYFVQSPFKDHTHFPSVLNLFYIRSMFVIELLHVALNDFYRVHAGQQFVCGKNKDNNSLTAPIQIVLALASPRVKYCVHFRVAPASIARKRVHAHTNVERRHTYNALNDFQCRSALNCALRGCTPAIVYVTRRSSELFGRPLAEYAGTYQ